MNAIDDLRNPYPGLRSYTGSEHAIYFGRDAQVNALIRNESNVEVFRSKNFTNDKGTSFQRYSDTPLYTFYTNDSSTITKIAFINNASDVNLLTRSSEGKVQRYIFDKQRIFAKAAKLLAPIRDLNTCKRLLKTDDKCIARINKVRTHLHSSKEV